MGGTAIGHLSPDGRWIDGEALTAVDADGAPLPRIPLSDSQTRTFPCTAWFQRLLAQGWVDAWRRRHPQKRE